MTQKFGIGLHLLKTGLYKNVENRIMTGGISQNTSFGGLNTTKKAPTSNEAREIILQGVFPSCGQPGSIADHPEQCWK